MAQLIESWLFECQCHYLEESLGKALGYGSKSLDYHSDPILERADNYCQRLLFTQADTQVATQSYAIDHVIYPRKSYKPEDSKSTTNCLPKQSRMLFDYHRYLAKEPENAAFNT